MNPPALDAYSLKLLIELQRDSRQTVQQLSEAVGLSATPCWKRIREMEEAGVITGYSAHVDPEQVGLALNVMVGVNLAKHSDDVVQRFEDAVKADPNIVRCVSTTGETDYVLNVLATDVKHFERLLQGTIVRLPGVTHVHSSIVLREVKSTSVLPIDDLIPRGAGGAGPLPRRRPAPKT
ncbi:MAG TPA: Lrp/AsnC family transcriptional regulator [Methylibium sp.]|uniref:Lrp/AsnC family transcriptional regulator n=1 Tax=Methylibium sp. TaxID=2067992 RepID=UPI002DBFFBCA|nr:Lrp/AsnC family transcriptional regulator [Methylibium sp.]HEU4460473.1 Lrp/AsnC family transcriptional regulator [Methylibium sp.]